MPFAVFPLVGVLTEKEVGAAYGDPLVLLFMGGFMLAQAAEHSGAHRRMAHAIVAAVGRTSGRRLVLAFMIATAFTSMWVSNTAAALMMLPVAMAVLECDASEQARTCRCCWASPTARASAASPRRSALRPTASSSPPTKRRPAPACHFTNGWSSAASIAVLMLAVAWLVLTWRLGGVPSVDVETEGEWTTPQKRILTVLGLTALAWITREIPFGGWSAARLGATQAGDTTVALVAVVVLFLLPSGAGDGTRLLDWATAKKIPWGVLLLFGGGIAIAKAFEVSGLSTSIGELVEHASRLADARGARRAVRRRHVLLRVHQQHRHVEHPDADPRRRGRRQPASNRRC